MKNDCPYCNEPLNAGYIVSGSGIYWNDRVPAFRCRGDEVLGISWAGCVSVVSYRCKKCKVFIIPKGHHRVRILDSGVCPFCGKDHKYSEEEISEDKIVHCKSCEEEFVYRE